MKNKVEIERVKPKADLVLVQLVKIPNRTTKTGIELPSENKFKHSPDNPQHYMGKVIDIGDKVTQVEKGNYVLFSMLDGYHIFTMGNDHIYKILEEDKITVYSKMSGMKIENVMTLGDRMLVDTKETKEALKSKGVYIPETVGEGSERSRDLEKGVVIKLSVIAKLEGYKEGDIVYFPKDIGLGVDELKGDGEYRVIKPRYIKFEYRPEK